MKYYIYFTVFYLLLCKTDEYCLDQSRVRPITHMLIGSNKLRYAEWIAINVKYSIGINKFLHYLLDCSIIDVVLQASVYGREVSLKEIWPRRKNTWFFRQFGKG